MKTLSAIEPLDNYKIRCTFDDGEKKIADISVYLQSPVFSPLQEPRIFKQVSNQGYFVEWADQEIDLSADTLWHIGV